MLIEELLEGFFVPCKTLGRDLEEKESTSFRIQHREDPTYSSHLGASPNKGGHEQDYVVIQLGFHMKAITAMVTIHCLQKLES